MKEAGEKIKLTDDEVEELLDVQFNDLGEDSGVLVQPEGCSNTQLVRVCRRMGVVIRNQRKMRAK